MVLDDDQLATWDRDGFLVLPDVASIDQCRALIERAEATVAELDPVGDEVSIFSTHEQTRTSDEHFLGSGGAVRCFFEEEAFDADGRLSVPISRAINKIGHAQHDLDPVYGRFARAPVLADLAADLGFTAPLLLQSMHIFKQPHIGGEVTCHQDATFLGTTPDTVVGFWFALEDATLDNGCLWAEPGGHRGPLRKRFERCGPSDAAGTRFVDLDPSPLPVPGEGSTLVPLPVAAGSLVVLHGLLPHWSGPNRSERSRQAYSLHLVDGCADYPATNWLQRPEGLPLRGF